jgi:hypothetical protein
MKKIYWVPLLLIPILLFFFLFKKKDEKVTLNQESLRQKNISDKKNQDLTSDQKKEALFSKNGLERRGNGPYQRAKVVFRKANIKGLSKKRKRLFPKGRLKNFPWRKGRPVMGVKFKPPQNVPKNYQYKNEFNPNWEQGLRNGLASESKGKNVDVNHESSLIIAQGNKAIFVEEVGVTIGDDGDKDQKKFTMIVDSGSGEVLQKIPDHGRGQGEKREPSSSDENDNSDQKWGEYSGLQYAQKEGWTQLETRKDDEKSLPSRINMTEEEKKTYENSF